MEPAVLLTGAAAGGALLWLTPGMVGGVIRRIPAVVSSALMGRAGAVAAFMAAVASGPLPRPVPAAAEVAPPLVRYEDHSRQRVAVPPPLPAAETYVVAPGDSLWSIACGLLRQGGDKPSAADIDRYWHRIYELNRLVIGDDPGLIHPGQTLELPTA